MILMNNFLTSYGFQVKQIRNPTHDTVVENLDLIRLSCQRKQEQASNQKKGQQEKMVFFYFFAGICLNDGSHALVINEPNDTSSFYKLVRVQLIIRSLAIEYPSTHHIVFFSSSKQLPASLRPSDEDREALLFALKLSLNQLDK